MRSAKRGRINRSDSLAEIFSTQPKQQRNAAEALHSASVPKPKVPTPEPPPPPPPPRRIFTLGSPVKVVERKRSELGWFIKECFYCEDLFEGDQVVYMYSGIAFCSHSCREMQILADENFELANLEPSQPAALRGRKA